MRAGHGRGIAPETPAAGEGAEGAVGCGEKDFAKFTYCEGCEVKSVQNESTWSLVFPVLRPWSGAFLPKGGGGGHVGRAVAGRNVPVVAGMGDNCGLTWLNVLLPHESKFYMLAAMLPWAQNCGGKGVVALTFFARVCRNPLLAVEYGSAGSWCEAGEDVARRSTPGTVRASRGARG